MIGLLSRFRLGIAGRSSFAPAFWLLPAKERRALGHVYAFARAVDDLVDVVGLDGQDPAAARAGLALWREALNGRPEGLSPRDRRLFNKLEGTIQAFAIPRRRLLELTDGVARDLDQSRYETFEDLKTYCYGVAGTVGLACLPIFGLSEARQGEFAETLGRAVQLVNILRDVKADVLRNRIYLPLEDMRRFGYGEEEALAMVYNDSFRRLMAFQSERAKEVFAQADLMLPPESRLAARPALAMGRLYRALLARIEARSFDVFTGRPSLGISEKFRAMAKSPAAPL